MEEQVVAAVTTGDCLEDKNRIHEAQASDTLIANVVSAIQQNTPLPLSFARQKEWLVLQSGI